jgi:heptosyltransferase-3
LPKSQYPFGYEVKMPKVGFFHQGALGDFILFMPVLDGLAKAQRAVSFELWTHPFYSSLFHGKPYRVSIHSCDAPFWEALFRDDAWMDVPIPEEVASCDSFFWVGQKRGWAIVKRLQRRLPFPVHVIQSFPKVERKTSVNRFLTEQFSALGWAVEEMHPSVVATPEASQDVSAWLSARGIQHREFLAVHIGSGGLGKVWPLRRWQGLLSYIVTRNGRRVVFLSGPADEPFASFVSWMSRQHKWPVAQGFPLDLLTAILAAASLYVGCDSGVSHLAAAVGAPSVVIIGPTNPRVWAPPGNHVHILQDRWHKEEILAWDPNQDAAPDPSILRKFEALLKKEVFFS